MKKILIFGNTGFIGSWLTEFLLYKNCKIYGYALKPFTNPSLHNILNHKNRINSQKYSDVLNAKLVNQYIIKVKPDAIVYLAAQPLVLESIKNPKNTYMINNLGLINFLESIKKNKSKNLKKIIIFTSDKVYKNLNNKKKYKEGDSLGGSDPYSASKACQEIISASYYDSYLKSKFTMYCLRAGNIVGGGDWSQYRLMTDIFNSLFNKKKLIIRNINHTRPWQHIIDVVFVINKLIFQKKTTGKYDYNIGPYKSKNYSVKSVLKKLKEINLKLKYSITKNPNLEKKFLSINSDKLYKDLKFKNRINFKDTLLETYYWYNNYYKKNDMIKFTIKQFKKYIKN